MLIWYVLFVVAFLFLVIALRGAPYVPTHRRQAEIALSDLYELSDKDVLVDVGSGDGIILRIAASKGARAIGYELNPLLALISRLLSRNNPLISIKVADFWLIDLPVETTVVYAFSVSRDIEKMARKIQDTADKNGHDVWFITYGALPESVEPVRMINAHGLYLFEPRDKA